MRLSVFLEPQQGASYDDQLRVARCAEQAGFDGFFRSDHYLVMGDRDGLPGPTDAWTTLAGLARETTKIRLGTMVTAGTFRLPGPLAITVAQVDAMSGGRVELGLGAGWYEAEHRAYGVPFPELGERFGRLAEQLEIITGLWSTPLGETFAFAGEHYQVADSPALPKPVQQPHPPVIVGGHGPRRTPRLAARFATEFNVGFAGPDVVKAKALAVATACEELGRQEPPITSVAVPICCGRDDAEVARRADAIGRSLDSLREAGGLVGTPEQVVEQLRQYQAVGVSRAHLQVLDLTDLAQLELVAEQVAPAL
ncbi:LLM class F420-dependent oxidoreductase [Natronosporangium hydrolyticum]|uniref:LLM class F420-dependent oxidoreductase n=1 Tax=Natronosporangium hydrolyticum TaxID=2811111 RepID=A0A895YH01_9ACTN|nr:LLM class F420-dependent oxidoreductase [Natronosporangium hydrolyticum]QSB13450.1 LLM class F420-dependent oxidoreductase [Natronosporangium hydrolyticum]